MSEPTKKKRIKRALNKRFVTLVSLLLLAIISIFKIPDFIKTRSLEDLGYSEEAISAIKAKRLDKEIIDGAMYSEYLDNEVTKDSFRADYLELYVYSEDLDDDDFLLYDRLIAKGYDEDQTINLFRELEFNELVPLLVFDKLESTSTYVSDCIRNRANNVDGNFTLDNDYLNAYEGTSEALDLGTSSVLVSKKFDLGDYIPQRLVPLTTQYASEGVELENDAYNAFIMLCDAMSAEGLSIYALNGYRSYEDQAMIYGSYSSTEEADSATTRPGFSESQTGLSVTIVDSANESLANFINTAEYQFIKDNGYRYGFIIRYPEGKSSITGYEGTPYQIRYVGIENAKAVHDSGLTWEEYYLLYLYEAEVSE